MNIAKFLMSALIAASTATFATAGQELAAPQDGPLKVKSAQLAIKSPGVNVCPTEAKVSGWIFTTKAGPVTYMIVRKGGQVGAPQTIQAVKGAAGYVASFTNTVAITTKIDAEYRILVSNSGGVVSNWAPMRASCKIQLGG